MEAEMRNWETALGRELLLTCERAALLERMIEATLTTDIRAICSGWMPHLQHPVIVYDSLSFFLTEIYDEDLCLINFL